MSPNTDQAVPLVDLNILLQVHCSSNINPMQVSNLSFISMSESASVLNLGS